MMTPEEIFRVWAPPSSPWSAWVAPVLFSRLTCPEEVASPVETQTIDLDWLGGVMETGTAIIVDLPGASSLEVGLALARRGYRPLPLYNASPGPRALLELNAPTPGRAIDLGTNPPTLSVPVAAIDMKALLLALCRGTNALRQMRISPEAPPAFLLDADRLLGNNPIAVGVFDNRWMVFPQDFPSAKFLLDHGIRSVLLVQRTKLQPQEDVAHVLLRWQESRIIVYAKDILSRNNPGRITVARPSRFRRAWYRALAIAGLRRNSAGGFGSVIPQSSAG
jgi:hypothetical protein